MNMIHRPGQPIVYPSSDGRRMAENTKQYEWIVMIKGNIDFLFRDNPNVFVAGDNLIYPVEGDPKTRMAPDVYVAFGRPKGHRGSYQVWLEGDIFPQVIFEILSPGNRAAELKRKRSFYSKYGALEYYVYDPDRNKLEVWLRRRTRLVLAPIESQFTSPLLGITFELAEPEMIVRHPNGDRFLMMLDISKEASAQKERADKLAAKLRELGLDPDTL